jgi:tellurite resistance protein
MHEEDLAILKGLVSVAWADGRVDKQESAIIDALLQAYRATPSEEREVRAFPAAERTIDDIPVTDLSFDDRRVLLQHAVLLTFVDGEQHDKEKKVLEKLCQKLRIPDLEARGIIEAAERRAKKMMTLL